MHNQDWRDRAEFLTNMATNRLFDHMPSDAVDAIIQIVSASKQFDVK
jgi:hypothetical protein